MAKKKIPTVNKIKVRKKRNNFWWEENIKRKTLHIKFERKKKDIKETWTHGGKIKGQKKKKTTKENINKLKGQKEETGGNQ